MSQTPEWTASAIHERLLSDGVIDTDVFIVGSGPGGGSAANGFIGSGQRVLVAERGPHIPQIPREQMAAAMYVEKRYSNAGTWRDRANGKSFRPGTYYYVGGNSNFYGAALSRFHAEDFEHAVLPDGVSAAWPFNYNDLEPYYTRVEELYRVRGSLGEDPSEPAHSKPYPFPAIAHDPDMERFSDSLKKQGLHPYHTANGLEVNSREDVYDERTSDGMPSYADRKSTSWNRMLKPAMDADPLIQLIAELKVTRLIPSEDGSRIVEAEGEYQGTTVRIRAARFILAAGAANTAALLLRSDVANSSGLVGRNYMVHNTTFLVGVNPLRRNRTGWQKTIGINDWYSATSERPGLGSVQMLGKLGPETLKGFFPYIPAFILKLVTDRSIDLCLITEEVANPDNRVTVDGDDIVVDWKRSNLAAHKLLVANVARAIRRAGFPFVFARLMDGVSTNAHMCGTTRAGTDPATSVVDADCRTHDLDNVWIVDASVFTSSGANNPALTISANALRVVEKIRRVAKAATAA